MTGCVRNGFVKTCDLMESVNRWCLFDSADSQGDGDKSPEPRWGEHRKPESAGKL